jgi:hypothetical protein
MEISRLSSLSNAMPRLATAAFAHAFGFECLFYDGTNYAGAEERINLK